MRFTQSVHRIVLVASCAGLLTLMAVPALAFTVTLTFDENGHGGFVNDAGLQGALPWSLRTDPGPGGLNNVLCYNLLNPPGLVWGDLRLFEPIVGTPGAELSDILRFDPNVDGGSIFVYSDISEGVRDGLADVGFPTGLYDHRLDMFEVGLEGFNGISYTPLPEQPGFVLGAGGPVTYNFMSDVVPEPGTVFLLLGGLGALGLAAWRRRN